MYISLLDVILFLVDPRTFQPSLVYTSILNFCIKTDYFTSNELITPNLIVFH